MKKSPAQTIVESHGAQRDPDLPTFLELSAALTGFSEVELEGTGMLDEYFYTLMKEQDHEGVRAFLKKAGDILDGKRNVKAAIKAAFMDPPPGLTDPNPPFDVMPHQALARRIILLWYTGVWTTMNWKETKSQDQRTSIVSARAYEEGLIWMVAQTHPAGAKQPGYGSWSRPPLGADQSRDKHGKH
ncbi:MAG: hypothetical protein C5B50_05700 [Verrucomicrobia bacterium]|nr:MAG: hypothetical protein C5B50_05700 [Verrucomicrobiota bacterium]